MATMTPIEGQATAILRVRHPWYAQGTDTVCDLTVTSLDVAVQPGRPHLIAWVHERADNPGLSITNAAEAVYLKCQGLVGPCYVVEHYDDASYSNGPPRWPGRVHRRETYDLVTVERGVASWRRLGHDPADVVAELVILAARP